MKIERDKFYKWDRRKLRAVCVDMPCTDSYPVLMADVENGMTHHFTSDGKYYMGDSSYLTEWIDAPTVDWSKMAAWHRWVAMDADGRWFSFEIHPRIKGSGWVYDGDGYNRQHIFIISEYAPKWSGDWKDSLTERPE